MCESHTKTEEQRQALAEFVRQETDGGREIMRFFLDVMRNRYEDAKMCHRIAAARELEKHGSLEAREFLKAVGRSENGRTPPRAPTEPRPKDELADFIKKETDNGKEIVRFLLDVVRNRDKDAGMGHKITAAKELLKRAFDNVLKMSSDENDLHRGAKECRIDKCGHATYTRYRWMVDGRDREALKKIYGSKEAVSFVRRAVVDHRKKIVFDHTYVPDHDFTPIENPEDDPYGKGSFGYEVLCGQFGDNQAIRVANKAAEEFNRQLAKDLENEEDSNEDPPAAQPQDPPAEADSKPTRDSQNPAAKHDSEHPHDTPVGAGLKPDPGLARPSTERNFQSTNHHPEPSHIAPEPPHVIPASSAGQALSEAEGTPAPTPSPSSAILERSENLPEPVPPTSSSTDPPSNDPPTPEPLRRSGRRRKHRLRRRQLAASRSGPVPESTPALAATSSDRGPPPL